MVPQDTDRNMQPQPSADGPSQNRYILLAVVAVVVVVTIFLLKSNMESPPAQQQAPPPGSGQPVNPADMQSSEQQMQQMMSQIEHIKGILVQDSSNFDAWAALGNMYFDIQMPEEAILHYRGALKVNPDDLNVQTDLATMLRGVGEQEEAIEILESVVAIDSTMHQAWFNLGVIYGFDFKDDKKALAAWKRFVALNPDSPNNGQIQQEIIRLEAELGS